MRTHAKICQDTIHRHCLVEPKEALHMPEVMRHEGQPRIIRQVASGIFILVEGDKPAFWSETLKHSPTMSATAEGQIDVNAGRFDGERIERFFQEHRHMIFSGIICRKRFLHARGFERSSESGRRHDLGGQITERIR